jgi:hypothetical protein
LAANQARTSVFLIVSLACWITAGVRWNALLGQQDLLREEIRRGRECLKHAQAGLAESRRQLEEWPTYEKRCLQECLPSLIESVLANRRVERFLTGWLKRREHQLAAAGDAIVRFAREYDLRHLLEGTETVGSTRRVKQPRAGGIEFAVRSEC